jgi:hydroxyatrazine ethylaminohydrolase
MSDDILIKNAAAIVTCDTNDTIFRDCDLLIKGPEIKEIGPNLTAGQAEVIDAADCFVYPGLINTHHHFFQTFVRNLLTVDYPNMLVLDWIRKIYQIFKRIDGDCIYYSSLVAMTDLIKHGCTTAYDHQYC